MCDCVSIFLEQVLAKVEDLTREFIYDVGNDEMNCPRQRRMIMNVKSKEIRCQSLSSSAVINMI